MDYNTILILSLIFGIVNYSLIAKRYFVPYISSVSRTQALIPLLFLHCFRYIGLAFLLTGVVSADLSPQFSYPAAFGDLLTALLALAALLALLYRWPFALMLVWIFNIVGSIDMVTAIYQGLRLNVIYHIGAAYFIPVLIVPALLVTHIIIFKLLLQPEASTQ